MARIAFFGTGAMGSRMATRLCAAGHELTVWNRSEARATPEGAVRAPTPTAAAEGADPGSGGSPFESQFQAGPDGIAVGGLSIPAKFEGDELPSGRGVIPEETKTRCGPVCYPDVQVAIEVPVNGGEAPAIIGKAKSAEGGHVCETCCLASGIQEGAVAFVAAEGAVFVKEPAECPPTLFVGSDGALGEIINRGLRHDLSPKETSQVVRVIAGDIAVRHQ